MDIHQLKTFITVAREGSLTRASSSLYLSQPAVSAHIKTMEDTLGLALFERTPRGMQLTIDGRSLLQRAEDILAAHRDLLDEAIRIKGRLSGQLRIGAGGGDSSAAVLEHLLMELAQTYPDLEVELRHGASADILKALRSGELDAGFYNEAGTPDNDLKCLEVGSFGVFLAASKGLVVPQDELDWQVLADLPWICPVASTCCGKVAENLFLRHNFRPKRFISVDHEKVTRSLLASGAGIGMLHEETAIAARDNGEVDLLCSAQNYVRVLFAHLAARDRDPLLKAVDTILCKAVC